MPAMLNCRFTLVDWPQSAQCTRSPGHLCDLGDEDFDLDSTQLMRRMKHLSNTLKRCRSVYLVKLRESHRLLLKKARGDHQVAVGDVVITHDEYLPRSFWRLGCIHKPSLLGEMDRLGEPLLELLARVVVSLL